MSESENENEMTAKERVFTIIGYNLMELLFPWMFLGSSPLYLVNKAFHSQWKKFLDKLMKKELNGFHPFRLISPSFDDRRFFPNNQANEVTRLFYYTRMMLIKTAYQVGRPNERFLFNVRQMMLWTARAVDKTCDINLFKNVYMFMRDELFPKVIESAQKAFLPESSPIEDLPAQMLRFFHRVMAYGAALLPACLHASSFTSGHMGVGSLDLIFHGLVMEKVFTPLFEKHADLDDVLLKAMKQNSELQFRSQMKMMLFSFLTGLAPKASRVANGFVSCNQPRREYSMTLLSLDHHECTVSEKHPLFNQARYLHSLFKYTRRYPEFGCHGVYVFPTWNNKVLELAEYNEKTPIAPESISDPSHPFIEPFANSLSYEEWNRLVVVGFKLGMKILADIFMQKIQDNANKNFQQLKQDGLIV